MKKKIDDVREIQGQNEEEIISSPGEENKFVNGPAPSDFILKCSKLSEMGDGSLYAFLNKGKFIFNIDTGKMMKWAGHYWEEDINKEHIAAAKDLAKVYMEAAKKLGGSNDKDRKQQLIERANHLLTTRGQKNCVEFAKRDPNNKMSVDDKIFDNNPWLLGCINGVLDLRIGLFRNGRQDDYISRVCPTEFRGLNTPAVEWEKALNLIFDRNQETIGYLQRILGYGITGLNIERVFPIFLGQDRSGKELIIDVISYVLGTFAGSVRFEKLLSNNSTIPKKDILKLKGLRLAVTHKIDKKSSLSTVKINYLTKWDKLIARKPHAKKPTEFNPTHLFILLTEERPQIDNFILREMVRLVEFPFSFVDKPKEAHERLVIKGLAEKLKSEASGILGWMVRGCLLWQKMGLKPTRKKKDPNSSQRG